MFSKDNARQISDGVADAKLPEWIARDIFKIIIEWISKWKKNILNGIPKGFSNDLSEEFPKQLFNAISKKSSEKIAKELF